MFGRRTFFGHFFQLFDDDARQLVFLGWIGLEYNLKHELFFRIFGEASAAAYAISTAFFLADFFGVYHIQCLIKDAQSKVVA